MLCFYWISVLCRTEKHFKYMALTSIIVRENQAVMAIETHDHLQVGSRSSKYNLHADGETSMSWILTQ